MLALLGYAARRGYVGENQARSSKVPKGNGAVADKVRPFSRAELRSLIDAASSTHSEYANLIEFAALTGARWGELAALRVSDLRSAQISEVVIARSKSDGYDVAAPKSGKTRVVPLLRRAHEIGQIQSAGKKQGDLLFRAPRGGPVNAGNLNRAVDWDSNTPDHRFHDLRHTAATTWINNRLDVKTVSVWLGHATSAITHRTYAGWLGADANADAIARLEESLRREGGQS
ncbi:MAG: site-specific integrase [Cryobacterium sp.]|nr:site-specific integrase [Cryobacterium sp.]